MFRITFAILLFSVSAIAAPKPPGIERPVSPPSRSINDGYARSGAVTNDGFSVLLQTGLRMMSAEVEPLATVPSGAEPLPLPISYQTSISGLPNGIVTAWMDGRRLFASVSSKVADAAVRRELPVHDTWSPQLHGVTTNRTNALVLAYDNERQHVWASILDANGTPVAAGVDVVPRGTIGRLAHLTAASDPAGFLVLHRDENQPSNLYATRVSNSGVVSRFTMFVAAGYTTALAAFDGSRYLIALQYQQAIHGILTSLDGSAQSGLFPIDSNAYLYAIAGRTDGSLLLSSRKAFAFDHILRTKGPDYAIAGAPNFVVSNGQHALVGNANDWRFPAGTGSAQWLDLQTGRPLTESFALSYGSPKQSAPAAALGDTVDLLVWAERDPATLKDAIRATRIARDGRRLDQLPLSLSIADTENARPAVAFNGRDFVVGWYEQIGDAGQGLGQRVKVQRVSQDGRMLDPSPREIGRGVFSGLDLEVSHIADTTLILWIGPAGNRFQTIGLRMNRDGQILDSTPLRITPEAGLEHWAFDVAAGHGGFLVVWGQYDGTAETLHSAQITTSGAIVGPTRLHGWNASSNYRPRVSSAERGFLVVSDKFATAFTTAFWRYPTMELDLDDGVFELGSLERQWAVVYGPQCCSGATTHAFLDEYNPWYPFDRSVMPIPEQDVVQPRIASDGKRAILTYSRPVHDQPHMGSSRVMYRLYGDPPPPIRRRTARP